jgi:hypothetical protein
VRSKEPPLSITHPRLAEEWDGDKNGDVTPDRVTAGSHRNVWWACRLAPDHEWSAAIYSRAAGVGCPYCAGRRASITNSLAAVRPDLAAQLHPTKNDGLAADQIPAGSHLKVWWRCPAGPDHEWPATIANRTVKNGRATGCPYCAGRRVSITNALPATHPQVAAQFHPTKNAPLTADRVVAGSAMNVWWLCASGHEWLVAVVKRTREGTGCPTCVGKRVSVANSLAARRPDLAAQLHPQRNGNLTAGRIAVQSNKSA